MKHKRKVMVIGGIVLVIAFVAFPLSVAILPIYPKFGRISDFQALGDNMKIPNAEDVVSFGPNTNFERTITIKDLSSQTAAAFSVPSFSTAEFNVIQNKNQTFIIFKLDSGGSNSAWLFDVYNISDNKVKLVDGAAFCAYPRLDGDSLEFELQEHCDFSPLKTWDDPIKIATIALH